MSTLILEILKGQCQGHADFEGLHVVNKRSYAIFYYYTPLLNHVLGV